MTCSSWLRVLMCCAVGLVLLVLGACRESDKSASLKTAPDCSNAAKLPEKPYRQCACQEIEQFLDEVMRIYQSSSQSVRTTRRQEMDQFRSLVRKLEESAVFLRLPVNLRDYVLSHNDAWEACRGDDDMDKCTLARSVRSTVVAMCKQWRDEQKLEAHRLPGYKVGLSN